MSDPLKTKLVVKYECHFGTPAEAHDPHAIEVEHRGATVHALYDRTVEQVFTFPAGAPSEHYLGTKAVRAATHKALVEKVKVGADEPDYFIPIRTTVQSVEVK